MRYHTSHWSSWTSNDSGSPSTTCSLIKLSTSPIHFIRPAISLWNCLVWLIPEIRWHMPCIVDFVIMENLSKRRSCQHGRQPEVNRVAINGEWWRQPFSFEIMNVKAEWLPWLISNENDWRHHSPYITARFTSGWRPCWQKRRPFKLSNLSLQNPCPSSTQINGYSQSTRQDLN